MINSVIKEYIKQSALT